MSWIASRAVEHRSMASRVSMVMSILAVGVELRSLRWHPMVDSPMPSWRSFM